MSTFKTYVCIDDTDEIAYEKSTGEIAEEIKKYIEEKFAPCSFVTRHQLFIHESIPYTSHNSSMCFITHLNEEQKDEVIEFIIKHLNTVCAPSSQPGLCIGFDKDIKDKEILIQYGLDAKQKVLTKENAYKMAELQNLHLSEHKNNGQGIIGALAGVALRIYGNDGRVKGKIKTQKDYYTVSELLQYKEIDIVQFEDGSIAKNDLIVETRSDLKMVYLNNNYVLLIEKDNDIYKNISRENLKKY